MKYLGQDYQLRQFSNLTVFLPYLIIFIAASIFKVDPLLFVLGFFGVFLAHSYYFSKSNPSKIVLIEDPEVSGFPTAIIDSHYKIVSKNSRFNSSMDVIGKSNLVLSAAELSLSPSGTIKKFSVADEDGDKRINVSMKKLPSGNYVLWIDDRDQLDLSKFVDTQSDAYRIDLLNVIDQVGAYGVVYVDIDGLDEINKTRGVASGNELIRSTARYLKSLVRNDYVLRTSDDEFAIVIKNASPERINSLEEKIVNSSLVKFNCSTVIGVGCTIKDCISRAKAKLVDRRHYERIKV